MSDTYRSWSNDGASDDYSGTDGVSGGVENGTSQYIQDVSGNFGSDASNTPTPETFTAADGQELTETLSSDVGNSLDFTDQGTYAGAVNDNVGSSDNDTTYTDTGTDYSITDLQGTDSFDNSSGDLSSGNGTQYGGDETFGLHDEYVDHFSDLSTGQAGLDGGKPGKQQQLLAQRYRRGRLALERSGQRHVRDAVQRPGHRRLRAGMSAPRTTSRIRG